MLTALQQGRRIDYGDLSVDVDGISAGRDRVPWREVESIGTKGGRIRIKHAGRWFNWSSAPVSADPDVFVLLALADTMRRTERPGR